MIIKTPYRFIENSLSVQSVRPVISFIDIVNSSKQYDDVIANEMKRNLTYIVNNHLDDTNKGCIGEWMDNGMLIIIYNDPIYALEKSIKIQDDACSFNKQSYLTPLVLKIGLHLGKITTKIQEDGTSDIENSYINEAVLVTTRCISERVAMSSSIYNIVFPRLKGSSDLFWFDDKKKNLKDSATPEKVYLASSSPFKSENPSLGLKLMAAASIMVLIGFAVHFILSSITQDSKLPPSSTSLPDISPDSSKNLPPDASLPMESTESSAQLDLWLGEKGTKHIQQGEPIKLYYQVLSLPAGKKNACITLLSFSPDGSMKVLLGDKKSINLPAKIRSKPYDRQHSPLDKKSGNSVVFNQVGKIHIKAILSSERITWNSLGVQVKDIFTNQSKNQLLTKTLALAKKQDFFAEKDLYIVVK